ncbi:MAG: hypothetical protein LBC61_01665 [Candidatus Peribacteria bacterium]|nr:hypothetical protein [Candidatus Peribacteria bacterium]
MLIFNFSSLSSSSPDKIGIIGNASGKNPSRSSIFVSGISNFSTNSSLVFSSKLIILSDFFRFLHIKNRYLYF